MQNYLSQPNTEKLTCQDSFGKWRFAASSMQGWRSRMEDAHIAEFNIIPNVHLFAVFDGHGGTIH
jgi:serine/threonine protein phosphatase PrpC